MVQLLDVGTAKQFSRTVGWPVTLEHAVSTYDTFHVTDTSWPSIS